jgi:glucosamine kinase
MLVANVNGKFKYMRDYIIAVDGGGTKCKAVLFSPDGEKLASSTTGPANIFSNVDKAIDSILSASTQLSQATGVSLQQCVLSAGCAGAGIPAAVKRFEQWQHPFSRLMVITDIHASCLAANNGEDCALLILGTGSCLASYKNTELKVFGGHGFLLGDVASGAWLGRELISWYLCAIDGLSSDIILEKVMFQSIGNEPSAIIERYANAGASDFAALANIVFTHQLTSPIAGDILRRACEYIVALVNQHASDVAKLFIDGGISGLYLPMLEKALAREIYRPLKPAETGAYLFAKSVLSHGNKLDSTDMFSSSSPKESL